jgi:hypothetical protein
MRAEMVWREEEQACRARGLCQVGLVFRGEVTSTGCASIAMACSVSTGTGALRRHPRSPAHEILLALVLRLQRTAQREILLSAVGGKAVRCCEYERGEVRWVVSSACSFFIFFGADWGEFDLVGRVFCSDRLELLRGGGYSVVRRRCARCTAHRSDKRVLRLFASRRLGPTDCVGIEFSN